MRHHIVGLDLGYEADYSALCLLTWDTPERPGALPAYHVPTLKRWPLQTPYRAIAAGVAAFFKAPPLNQGALLVIDATGVGRPVVEMVSAAMGQEKVKGKLAAVTITSGFGVKLAGDGEWHVSKQILVSTLSVVLQNRRLEVAAALPEAKTLVRELQAFRMKTTRAGTDTYSAWRQRDHDDLVLSVALACWAAEGMARAERQAAEEARRRPHPRRFESSDPPRGAG